MPDHLGPVREEMQAAVAAAPEEDGEEQLDLLPDPMAGLVENEAVSRRVRGRNKRDQELVDVYRRMGYRTPMERWFVLANMPVDELAKALSCKLIEAFDRQQRILEALAPYCHARAPIAVDAGEGVGGLVIIQGDGSTVQVAQRFDPRGEPVEPQNSADPGAVLDASVLDASEKSE